MLRIRHIANFADVLGKLSINFPAGAMAKGEGSGHDTQKNISP